ncbi:glutamate synthase subunit beta [Smaragdicoccus niigatensis]|uniref:glutamate synthase subunit beta n=1 Tax=Smaragdicoccus niigatensis TaxID=359359 RepID=UPI000364345E|nr:glutamate synthase subunit beta [Smaragdicoccus niigatensis]
MADAHGFLNVRKRESPKRPVSERINDWNEIYVDVCPDERNHEVRLQAHRCMDCGIPFCHSGSSGCPLGNLIPEWNELVRRGQWSDASERLHATNNFPEFTGRLCPAPCESACVLSIAEEDTGGSVTIKRIEQAIADVAWESGGVPVHRPETSSGKHVAVVGSGPAGLAVAQQLTRVGHEVTVYERDDRLGGLLRYGIPAFKMDKDVLNRRLFQMREEGTRFVTSSNVGVDITVGELRSQYDAIVLATGALDARDNRDVGGRELGGIHLAMDYLVPANHECEGDGPSPINAHGKHVVIIGGGDTGSDCLGTAHRQGAKSIVELDYHCEPPAERDESTSPWPSWPLVLRTSPAHAEGGERRFQVAVQRFVGGPDGRVRSMVLAEVQVHRHDDGRREIVPIGDEFELRCDLALFAIGFHGTEEGPLLTDLGLRRSRRGGLTCGLDWQTDAPGVFVCGDAHRGASLVVWAIAEGRSVAAAVDEYLMGHSELPAPVHPMQVPLTVM